MYFKSSVVTLTFVLQFSVLEADKDLEAELFEQLGRNLLARFFFPQYLLDDFFLNTFMYEVPCILTLSLIPSLGTASAFVDGLSPIISSESIFSSSITYTSSSLTSRGSFGVIDSPAIASS
ncbi:hypothetical protein P5640_26580 (plasmid) [Bacillus subtilis]